MELQLRWYPLTGYSLAALGYEAGSVALSRVPEASAGDRWNE
jgi:hypothetical protein